MVAPIGKLPLSLGQVVATPGALAAMQSTGESAMPFLIRHSSGDWGDVCDEDSQSNDDAVREFERVISAYTLKDQTTIWIITEHDRSVTTILLPSEY